jgi:cytochrome c peroxidase
MYKLVVFIFVLSFLSLTYKNSLFYIPKNWPKPTYDFKKNKLTKEKVLLGKILFYDPILSQNNTISCVSCHSPYNAFAHTDHKLSHGINDLIGTRNAPALMNLAWQNTYMMDGAIHHLDVQSLAPISNPKEMGSSIDSVVNRLNNSLFYKKFFTAAWGDNKATGERVLKSIAQFMLTVISANSKYDKVMLKEAKFTDQEQIGYQLFIKNCASCHKDPLFTTYDFANNGLPLDSLLNDYGRMMVTKNPADSLKFKIPTLRNIEFTFPYMHDGRFKKLSDVMNHYTKGIKESKTLGLELKEGISLSSNEKVDIIAFLLTLTDKEFVFDKKYEFPKELMSH